MPIRRPGSRIGMVHGAVIALALASLTACEAEGSHIGPVLRTPLPTTIPALQQPSRVLSQVRVGGSPCGIAGAAGAIWVSDAQRSLLFRIDPATGKAQRTASLDLQPCEMTYAFGALWVVTQSGRVDKVNPKTGKVVARVAVGQTSYEAVATEDAIWVSNRGSGSLSRIDPKRDRVTFTLQIPDAQPGGLAYAAGALWVGDDTSGSTKMLRVDPKSHRVTRVEAGGRPAYVASAGDSVWVSNQDDGTVTQIDPTTAKATATIAVEGSPVNLDGLPAKHPEVWVPDDVGDRLVRIDATAGRVIEVVPVGTGPAVVAPVDGDIWTSIFQDGQVWQVRPGSLS